jgi:hypothetical protein
MADLREPLLDVSQQQSPTPEADIEQQLIEGMSPPSDGSLLFEDATSTHPLLAGSKTTATISVETESDASTFLPCTFNLSKVILGASMMAIPKAFAILGVILGSVLLTFCALLTAFTVDGLMDVSERLKIKTYSELVRQTCGRPAQYLLQVGIALTCFGNMVIYLVVIADVLVGSSPAFSGVLPEVLHISPASHLLMSRPAVLAMVCLFVLLPLVSLRNMARCRTAPPVHISGVALPLSLSRSCLSVSGVCCWVHLSSAAATAAVMSAWHLAASAGRASAWQPPACVPSLLQGACRGDAGPPPLCAPLCQDCPPGVGASALSSLQHLAAGAAAVVWTAAAAVAARTAAAAVAARTAAAAVAARTAAAPAAGTAAAAAAVVGVADAA